LGTPPVLYSPRFDFLLADPGDDGVYGTWPRLQLLEMDLKFCEAVERAFARGSVLPEVFEAR